MLSKIEPSLFGWILISLTNLSVVIDDLFQVKSLRSSDSVKIQGVMDCPPPLKPPMLNNLGFLRVVRECVLMYLYLYKDKVEQDGMEIFLIHYFIKVSILRKLFKGSVSYK